jgi:hypothetical protein
VTPGPLGTVLRLRRQLTGANLRRRGWEDGLLGGDPRWLALGALAWGAWLVAWAWRKEPEIVYRTALRGDETLVITSRRPDAARRR